MGVGRILRKNKPESESYLVGLGFPWVGEEVLLDLLLADSRGRVKNGERPGGGAPDEN